MLRLHRYFNVICLASLTLVLACSSEQAGAARSGGSSPTNTAGAAVAGSNANEGSGAAPGGGAGGSSSAPVGGASAAGNGASAAGTGGGQVAADGGSAGSVTAGSSGAGTGGGATGGTAAGDGTATGALHVHGNRLEDGDGKAVLLRGPELVLHWGVYSGLTDLGVDVPWEGGKNNNVGPTEIREVAKTKASALRIFGGVGNELDEVLRTAIVEQKMYVVVARVDWTNADMKATLQNAEHLQRGVGPIAHPRFQQLLLGLVGRR